MHNLVTTPCAIADGSQAIDLDQSPADILFLSAADTELSAIAAAHSARPIHPDFLRLTPLASLTQPRAVDLYVAKTAVDSRLVILRALGGLPYWRYAIEQLAEHVSGRGRLFAALPGDDRPDAELRALSNIPSEAWLSLHGYCVEGGVENFSRLLDYCRHLLGEADAPPPPAPLLRAGRYWPGQTDPSATDLVPHWQSDQPIAALIFYRALLQSGDMAAIDAMIDSLQQRCLNPLPIYIASTKDPVSVAILEDIFEQSPPDIVLNTTNFAIGSPGQAAETQRSTMLDAPGRPVLQVIAATAEHASWVDSTSGLAPRDIAMSVALPEVDGRIISRAVSFKSRRRRDHHTQCEIAGYTPDPDRVDFVADLAAAWTRLANCPPDGRRIAILLANYPNRDGRIANGVGLDTPSSLIEALRALGEADYRIDDIPICQQSLMDTLLAGPTNDLSSPSRRAGGVLLDAATYETYFAALPRSVQRSINERWGQPDADPFLADGQFRLAFLGSGNVRIGIQPARGYNIDPSQSHHDPALVPPHNYLAFYIWIRHVFGAHAVIHFGKHGNLEWLPGKSVALSSSCFTDAVLGPMPNIYPFIVNDPGEGTQAKRRSQAVIIDHLTPPLTRAGTFGRARDLERLLDEYHEALTLDTERARHLHGKILEECTASHLDLDAGLDVTGDPAGSLDKLDAYLCDLKESQIRDGLHIFGLSPTGRLERDLICAMARLPRGTEPGDASLTRAIAADLGMANGFDPLDCDLSAPWCGVRPESLSTRTDGAWRTTGDTVERLEDAAAAMLDGDLAPPGPASLAVKTRIESTIGPSIRACGEAEISALLTALDGRFVRPGPSGAPSRGRPDLLPTGRNFYSLDSRSLPTRTAWDLGWKSAALLIERYRHGHGDWPRRMAITAWGTSNMRTGGDDIAQFLALIGARPRWSVASDRVEGFEILPVATLGRPRIDATLRVSGFFRDAFPTQIDLVASAARAVMELDEEASVNPAAAAYRAESASRGASEAGFRVFGSRPGAYGAGLQAMLDERLWSNRSDLAAAYLEWGSYAYGCGADGTGAVQAFRQRLTTIDAVVQNQDNREHDLLDSDDYYQFEGGLAATVESLRGAMPAIYHMDHSRPERPIVRTLEEEIGRVVRSRATNPKWIAGVKRHGYKGAFEIAATVQYLFAFAATTSAVRQHHFELVHDAYIADADTREFMHRANPAALRESCDILLEAIDRGIWHPRSNSVRDALARLASAPQSRSEGHD